MRTIEEATAQELLIANVVVIRTDITEVRDIIEDELGGVSLEIRSTGDGPLTVLRHGQRADGKWSRYARASPGCTSFR